MLNCLPKFVSLAEPFCVTLSSVSSKLWWEDEPIPWATEADSCKFKVPGFSVCLYLALATLIT